ncbi:MAG TPA: hypothetical protein VFZ68_08115 [Acidimicrobiales bacterium]
MQRTNTTRATSTTTGHEHHEHHEGHEHHEHPEGHEGHEGREGHEGSEGQEAARRGREPGRIHESTAEREGIVDQQDAALEAIEEIEGDDEGPMSGPAPTG